MKSIIFIDLDGTLMRKDLSVSIRNKKALQNAIADGYAIVLLSGRPIKFVEYIADSIHKDILKIGFNGAYSDNLIDIPIAKSELKKVVKVANKYTNKLLVKSLDHIYASGEVIDDFVYPISNGKKIGYTENVDIQKLINNDIEIYKVLGMYNLDSENQLNEELKLLNIPFVSYKHKGFEITNLNANKGTAAQKICELYNVDVKECIFFGDDSNDVSMFSLGGQNMVMGNADDEYKKYATKVCESCENDGVGKTIEEILGGYNYE